MFRARAQGLSLFDSYPNRFGYVSDTYPCAPALCLEAVFEGYPLCGTRPYDYSSQRDPKSNSSVRLRSPDSCESIRRQAIRTNHFAGFPN